MLVPGMVYATEELIAEVRGDPALQQVANVACLPGIVGQSMAMPDFHYGYGFPIGGVAATRVDEGVVSPGGVGYDINCGVRLLRTELSAEEIQPKVNDIVGALFAAVPAGVGSKGRISAAGGELDDVLEQGAGWAVRRGYGTQDDLEHCEENGCIEGADPGCVSDRAHKRGRPQLGTLGSGNHFLEVQMVDQIYDQSAAQVMGILEPGQVTVMIHTGSRGFGHQVCDDYIERMHAAVRKYDIDLPDRELVCAPVESPEAKQYLSAMACAANYAWANRQCITHRVREAFADVLGAGPGKLGLQLVYDVCHNIAKLETHEVDGEPVSLCVHRKGATRAFAPGADDVPARYRDTGQPVIVPGDMGTASYVLVGTEGAMEQTFGSTCHGAGRRLSRRAALRRKRSGQVFSELRQQGIAVRAAGKRTLAEEMPEAYKDIDAVIAACHGADISRKVCRLRPLGVTKG
jgi:tRNA-splicing ligase RtcB